MRLIDDCDILKCIPPSGGDNLEPDNHRLDSRYQCCKGWSDFKNLGISVIAFWDCDTCESAFFTDIDHKKKAGNIAYFSQFINRRRGFYKMELWGFNSKNFNDKLCQATGLDIVSDRDLLSLVKKSAYGSEDEQNIPRGYDYSLGAIASINKLGGIKSRKVTVKLWQYKDYDYVIDYCLRRVRVSAVILRKLENGKLIDPNTGQYIPRPQATAS